MNAFYKAISKSKFISFIASVTIKYFKVKMKNYELTCIRKESPINFQMIQQGNLKSMI